MSNTLSYARKAHHISSNTATSYNAERDDTYENILGEVNPSKKEDDSSKVRRRRWQLLILRSRELLLCGGNCRKLLLSILFITALIVILAPKSMCWLWQNISIYLQCPEKPFFQRRPNLGKSNFFFGDAASKPAVIYVSGRFGNLWFKKQMRDHEDAIIKSGVFRRSEMHLYLEYPPFIRANSVWSRHLRFLRERGDESRRGAGYWFWKPVLIEHHLRESLSDGDFLVYTDSDRLDFLSWIALLLETMMERDADMALEQMYRLERQWTKGDVYEYFCAENSHYATPDQDSSTQYSGNFVVLRKNDRTMEFVTDWLEAAKQYHLISDENSTLPNAEDFEENRHDQSMLSLLTKCRYGERGKQEFPWTCLGDWTAYTFQLA